MIISRREISKRVESGIFSGWWVEVGKDKYLCIWELDILSNMNLFKIELGHLGRTLKKKQKIEIKWWISSLKNNRICSKPYSFVFFSSEERERNQEERFGLSTFCRSWCFYKTMLTKKSEKQFALQRSWIPIGRGSKVFPTQVKVFQWIGPEVRLKTTSNTVKHNWE